MKKNLPVSGPLNPANAAELLAKLADEAGQSGFFVLQDASFILLEAVRERLEAEEDLSADLNEWLDLVKNYPKTANQVVPFLRKPSLNLPLSDDEFSQFAEMLLAETGADVSGGSHQNQSAQQILEQMLGNITNLAEQAAADGLYGFQDLNLLVADALSEQISRGNIIEDQAFLSQLTNWPSSTAQFRQAPIQCANTMFSVLRNANLKLPMAEEELAMLREQLLAEVAPPATAQSDMPTLSSTSAVSVPRELVAQTASAPNELVALLLMQAKQVQTSLQTIMPDDKASVMEGLQDANDQLERFVGASNAAGFNGLAQISNRVISNVEKFIQQADAFTETRLILLLEWINQVQEYLPQYEDESAGQMLIMGLTDENWAMPYSYEDLAVVLTQLKNESSSVVEQSQPSRVENATNEDVSLELPSDVNQELLELLLQELPVQTQQFSEAVQRLQSGGNEKDLEVAQRIAHTLKGSANTVGIKGIAVLTHQLEDILIACAQAQKLPGRSLASALVNASDCLEGMSEALLGMGQPPSDAKAVLQEVLNWANRIDEEGLPETDDESSTPRVASEAPETAEAEGSHAAATMVRVSGELVDNLFRLSGESLILNTQADASMKRMKTALKAMQTQFNLLQELGTELEQLIDLKDLTGRSFGAADTDFDALEMDQYNELHTASRRMAEAAVDAREISLDMGKELDFVNELMEMQQRMVVDTQDIVMQTRLVSVSTVIPRFQRSLRQTCRMTDKQAEMVVVGEKLMVDGDTLNSLIDPLMHILRNAVDHGIESAEDRQLLGKPEAGQITFEFDREGNNIHVRCRDDGKGLDYGAIRAAAESRGLLKPGQTVTEDELKMFILRPNFSSRTVSTQTSGRGVGMDVVRAQIINLGGTLNIDSVKGQGMAIDLRVPLPLSMTYALLTFAGRYKVAVSNKGVNQIVYSASGEVVTVDGKEWLEMDGVTYPVARLMDLLNIPDHRKIPRTYSAILLVQNDRQTTAVLLDAISESLNAVIKGMGSYLGKIPGYIGATILGDGTVVPVIDVPELLRLPPRAGPGDQVEILETVEPTSNLPVVLVVDDSLSQRRALEQLLTDAGFRVRTARDGLEAAEILSTKFKADIVLTDLEMPRMNGIELARDLRGQLRFKGLPVIMVTSRTTQKHRQLAEEAGIDAYFSKPVREEELLTTMNTLINSAAEQRIAQVA